MKLMDKKELLLQLIEMYGAQRESAGVWHVIGKCGQDLRGNEAAAKKQADELLTAIENVLDGREFVLEIKG